MSGDELWLDPIPKVLHDAARAALDERDVIGFLGKADNLVGVVLVYRNAAALQARGVYESALLHAPTMRRINNHGMSMDTLRYLIDRADRGRLQAAGDPLPGRGHSRCIAGWRAAVQHVGCADCHGQHRSKRRNGSRTEGNGLASIRRPSTSWSCRLSASWRTSLIAKSRSS